jgi:hypothetical protein
VRFVRPREPDPTALTPRCRLERIARAHSTRGGTLAWHIEGRFFENCPCDVPCPCAISFSLGADVERCTPVLVFHIDSGEIEGVDVSGLSILAVADTPRVMTEGNWRLGAILDAAASDEQAEKLGAVLGGQLGGPMAALAPLIGENTGLERLPIEFSSEKGRHSVRAGDAVDVEVEDVVPFGSESGEPARLAGVLHPAGSELTVSKASRSKITVFGLDLAHEGKSALSTAFSWEG